MPKPDALVVQYQSFSNDGDYTSAILSGRLFKYSGYDAGRMAILSEDNTALGNWVNVHDPTGKIVAELRIRFPREISLLRNAQATGAQSGEVAVSPGSPPSPYLHFSLKDYSAQDSIPQFSRENTPLSQEAQLMAIARELHRRRAQFIEIAASNVLDQVFLAQFLHRACPDARLVFFSADLLMVREIDNVPFIGSITITPYPLIGLGAVRGPGRFYTSSGSEAYYNAASYTFWDGVTPGPLLQGGRSMADRQHFQPPLWATTIGSDGYYPLAILSLSSSGNPQILPKDLPQKPSPSAPPQKSTLFPSRLWDVLCAIVCFLCALHVAMLWTADYWSPFTRDLAIPDNDQPRRRSMYIHVATTMLFSMAFVVSSPVLCLYFSLKRLSPGAVAVSLGSGFLSLVTLAVGILAVFASVWKTRKHIGWVSVRVPPKGRPARFPRI